MLSMYVDEYHRNWDIMLPYVMFAYNTARQESAGFSPFYLLYGREPNMTTDLDSQILDIETATGRTDAGREHQAFLQRQLSTARHIVQDRLGKARKNRRPRTTNGTEKWTSRQAT